MDSSNLYIKYTSIPKINKVHSLSLKGVIAERQGKVKKALDIYSKGVNILNTELKLPLKQKNQSMANLLVNRGGLYHKQGQFKLAVDDYIVALRIRKELGEIDEQLIVLNNIGGIYLDTKDYQKSQEYYLEMHNIASDNQLNFLDMYAITGLASSLFHDGKIKKSIQYFKQAKMFAEKFKDNYCQTIVYQNLSKIYLETNDLVQAELFTKKAIQISRAISDPYLEAESLNTLSKININKFQIQKAVASIDSAIIISSEKGYDELRTESYRLLSLAYSKSQNFKSAFSAIKNYMNLKDSLLTVQNKKDINEIITKYEVEQKNNEILSQKLEIKRRGLKNTRLMFLLVVSFLLIVVFGFMIHHRQKMIKHERHSYENEVRKNKSLTIELEKKKSETKQSFKEREYLFHSELKRKYRLTEAEIEYWIFQVNGVSEKDMQIELSISAEGVKSRRRKLYEKLKEYEDINSDQRFSRADSVRTYSENRLKYLL